VAGDGGHFAQVPNDLALAWASLKLSPAEAAVVLVLQVKILGAYDPIRHCVGRRDARVSSRELADLTGFTQPRIVDALRRLKDKNVLRVLDSGEGRRPMRLALCRDARLLRPPPNGPSGVAREEGPAPDLETALAAASPELRAAMEGVRGVAIPLGQSQAHEGSCGVGSDSPGGITTRLPDTSDEKETARDAASEDASRSQGDPEGAEA